MASRQLVSSTAAFSSIAGAATANTSGLLAIAAQVLNTASPVEKVRLTRHAAATWGSNARLGTASIVEVPDFPARPEEPRIIPVYQMPKPKDLGVASNVWMLHSLAHVELNAIDLSLDTLVRFISETKEPEDFAADFLSIAEDEARHFSMLSKRLEALGSYYGALPAHNIVWNAANVSMDNLSRRLVLGQLVQEARGLDAGPKLAQKLTGTRDNISADIVSTIADEELRHVEIGVKWFLKTCEVEEVLNPIDKFQEIALQYANPGAIAPPFDEKRRKLAGLDPEWYLPVAEQFKEQLAAKRLKKLKLKDKLKEKEDTLLGQ